MSRSFVIIIAFNRQKYAIEKVQKHVSPPLVTPYNERTGAIARTQHKQVRNEAQDLFFSGIFAVRK